MHITLHLLMGQVIMPSLHTLNVCVEHLITSFGYFNMGNVFATQGKMDKAVDFLRKVTDIWYKQLILAISRETMGETIPSDSNATTRTSKTSFSNLTHVTTNASVTVNPEDSSEMLSLDSLGK